MANPLIIKHPLEEYVSSGNISDLDQQGRNSLDSIMTMIGDLRLRKGSIEGTCARYFLFVDLSVLRNLCASAHIDCDKLREYIRRFDCADVGESEAVSDDPQTAFPFVREEGPRTSAQDPPSQAQLPSESDTELTRLPAKSVAMAIDNARPPHELQIRNPAHGPASPQASAAQTMSDKRLSR